MVDKSLAEKLHGSYAGYIAFLDAEDELEAQFEGHYGENWFELLNYGFYAYHIRVEFKGRDPNEEDAAFARSLGFQKVELTRMQEEE